VSQPLQNAVWYEYRCAVVLIRLYGGSTVALRL
jgi:hypothetical protein